MKSKFLSVVVPVYKTEKYLSKCLDSIICQTFRDIEIVCVNDGSPDNSNEILSRYEQLDPRIVVLEIPNGGLSIARNVALDYIFNKSTRSASFDEHFVAFVDSDDYIDHSTFENALMHFEGDIDAVSFGYERVSENGDIKKGRYNISNYQNYNGTVKISDDVIVNTFPAVWSIIFKAEIIKNNNLRFPERLRYEDNYFTFIYLLFCRSICYMPAYPYKYLIRTDSITGLAKVNDYSYDFILIAKSILSYLVDKNILSSRDNFFWQSFYLLVLAAVSNCINKDIEERIYTDAADMIKSIHRNSSNYLFDHYDELIYSRKLKDCNIHKLFGIFKIKHRPKVDKYYFLGVQFMKILYNDKGKSVKVFGVKVY